MGITVKHLGGRPAHDFPNRRWSDILRDRKCCCGRMSATVRAEFPAASHGQGFVIHGIEIIFGAVPYPPGLS